MSNRPTGEKTRRSVLKSGAVISAFAGVGGVASIGRAARGNGRATPWPDLLHVKVSSTFGGVPCGDSESLEIDSPVNQFILE